MQCNDWISVGLLYLSRVLNAMVPGIAIEYRPPSIAVQLLVEHFKTNILTESLLIFSSVLLKWAERVDVLYQTVQTRITKSSL